MKKLIFTLLLLITLAACGTTSSEEPIEYTIRFDATEGTYSDGTNMKQLVLEEGQMVSLPEEPTKEGYLFVGWYTDAQTLTQFDANQAVSSDVTVYAKWIDNEATYTITLMYNGEVYDTVIAAKGIVEELPDLVVEGYSLFGWYSDPELTNKVSNQATYTEDTTLYAKVTPIQTYIFLMNESILLDYKIVEYGEVWDLSTLEFTFEGFTLEGFYSDYLRTNEITEAVGGAESQYVFANFVLGEDTTDLTTLDYYEYLSDDNPEVVITTNLGVMTLQLFPSIAPNTVNNFISYIQSGSYSGSTFHRVITEFMIQGGIVDTTTCAISGDFHSNGYTNPLRHTRGVISMARTSYVDSATSQFFIVHEASAWLDGEYASFGGLTHGFNVLDLIAIKPTNDYDMPLVDIVIESITIELNGYVVDDVVCAN